MTPEELRLECLKLVQHSANASGMLLEPGQIISRARLYADFVLSLSGRGGAKSVTGTAAVAKNGLRRRSAPMRQFESSADNSGVREASDAT